MRLRRLYGKYFDALGSTSANTYSFMLRLRLTARSGPATHPANRDLEGVRNASAPEIFFEFIFIFILNFLNFFKIFYKEISDNSSKKLQVFMCEIKFIPLVLTHYITHSLTSVPEFSV